MSRRHIWSILVLGTLACRNPGPPPPEPCATDADCAVTEVCYLAEERCRTLECATDSDCEVGRYCSSSLCMAPCAPGPIYVGRGEACVDGRIALCTDLGDEVCDQCEDKCPGQACEPGVGCVPLAALGEPCERDADCNTANCSRYANVCRVPFGASCDDTNCDECLHDLDGWSYCSRECGYDPPGESCPRCLGRRNSFYHCRPPCSGSCPGDCDRAIDDRVEYCGANFRISSPPRDILQHCRVGSHCESGTCLGRPICPSTATFCVNAGYCTDRCATDADCGADGRCVDVDCGEGVPEELCGALCMPACTAACPWPDQAECRYLPRVSGDGTVRVCDPRAAVRFACDEPEHCQSGRCSSEFRCIPPEGSGNGSACVANEDCASGSCRDEICRGTALRGEPCTSSSDCAAGTCVGGVCD